MSDLKHQTEYDGAPHSGGAFIAFAAVFIVAMMSSTIPTPLYPIYQEHLGFSQLTVTVIFAAYAVGVVGALIVAGAWSDQVGRRPILAAGLAFCAASALIFLLAESVEALLFGRLLSGISVGLFTGTATIALVELSPKGWRVHAPFVATAANMGGVGVGPLFAGINAEYLPWPLQLSYAIDFVLALLALLVVWRMPETVRISRSPSLRLRPIGVPKDVRAAFIPASIAAFSAFMVTGLFTSVAPAMMIKVLHFPNYALIGGVILSLFIASLYGQWLQRHLRESIRLGLGCVGLVAGTMLIGASALTASISLLLAGALVAGMGHGVTFGAGVRSVTDASPSDRRAEVASTFFIVGYIAVSVPVVGMGFGATLMGLRNAAIVFSCAVAVIGIAALGSIFLRARLARPVGG